MKKIFLCLVLVPSTVWAINIDYSACNPKNLDEGSYKINEQGKLDYNPKSKTIKRSVYKESETLITKVPGQSGHMKIELKLKGIGAGGTIPDEVSVSYPGYDTDKISSVVSYKFEYEPITNKCYIDEVYHENKDGQNNGKKLVRYKADLCKELMASDSYSVQKKKSILNKYDLIFKKEKKSAFQPKGVSSVEDREQNILVDCRQVQDIFSEENEAGKSENESNDPLIKEINPAI